MSASSKAKMFLADERHCNEADWYRVLKTFNSENYFSEHKRPFDRLYALNDQTLAAGQTIKMNVEEGTSLYLLPVVGSICCKSAAIDQVVNPGQLSVSHIGENTSYQISNPYGTDLINFLELRVKTAVYETGNNINVFDFDLDEDSNKIVTLTNSPATRKSVATTSTISAGKFDGRNEADYTLRDPANKLFVFIIEGVFEVQGRLLHARDGLALWDEPGPIELEALSNDAIVLLVELDID